MIVLEPLLTEQVVWHSSQIGKLWLPLRCGNNLRYLSCSERGRISGLSVWILWAKFSFCPPKSTFFGAWIDVKLFTCLRPSTLDGRWWVWVGSRIISLVVWWWGAGWRRCVSHGPDLSTVTPQQDKFSKEHLRIFSGQRERGKAKGTSASSCDDTAVGSMARHDDALWCVVFVVFLASFTEYILLFFSFSYFSKTTSFFPFDILQGISVKVQSNKWHPVSETYCQWRRVFWICLHFCGCILLDVFQIHFSDE